MSLQVTNNTFIPQNTKLNQKPQSINPSIECKNDLTLRDLPDFKNYTLAFLGKKNYTPNERDFLNFRKDFSTKLHKINTQYSEAQWDFYINSTEENNKKQDELYTKSMALYQDEKTLVKLNAFKNSGISDPTLKRHLNNLIDDFNTSITYKEDLKKLNDKENEISMKFNEYRGIIDGKEYSNISLKKMLQEEKDVDKRKQVWLALKGGGDVIAKDLVELVKMRNEFAQKRGYPDFFNMTLKESYKVEEKEIFNLLDTLTDRTEKISKKVANKANQKLAEKFNISPEEVMPWHSGLREEGNVFKEADKYIKSDDDLLPITKSLYKKMGWDLDSAPIQYDIFPREKKNQHGFCFDIDTPKDVRILANLKGDIDSLETLNHENGHAVYDLGISNHIPYLDRHPASSALTEAVAMLIESLPYREGNFLKNETGMPEDLIGKLENKRKEGLINFKNSYLKYINFEKEMYKNPDQDLAKLWFDMGKKYCNTNVPDVKINEWASVPHFLTHPAYLQNYLRAEIMAAQIYNSVTDKVGKMTESKETREILEKKLFKDGSSNSEQEAIKKLTGSELKVDAFLKQLETVEIN